MGKKDSFPRTYSWFMAKKSWGNPGLSIHPWTRALFPTGTKVENTLLFLKIIVDQGVLSLSLSLSEVAVSWQCPSVSRSIWRRLVQCCIVSLMRKYPAWSYGDMVCLIRFSSIFKTNMVCPTIRMLEIYGMFCSSLGGCIRCIGHIKCVFILDEYIMLKWLYSINIFY